MSQATAVMIVEISVAEQDDAEVNDWYTNVHLPELCSLPGVRSARRFAIFGEKFRYLAIYELDDVGVVESEAYKVWRAKSDDTTRMAAKFASFERTLATKIAEAVASASTRPE